MDLAWQLRSSKESILYLPKRPEKKYREKTAHFSLKGLFKFSGPLLF